MSPQPTHSEFSPKFQFLAILLHAPQVFLELMAQRPYPPAFPFQFEVFAPPLFWHRVGLRSLDPTTPTYSTNSNSGCYSSHFSALMMVYQYLQKLIQ